MCMSSCLRGGVSKEIASAAWSTGNRRRWHSLARGTRHAVFPRAHLKQRATGPLGCCEHSSHGHMRGIVVVVDTVVVGVHIFDDLYEAWVAFSLLSKVKIKKMKRKKNKQKGACCERARAVAGVKSQVSKHVKRISY